MLDILMLYLIANGLIALLSICIIDSCIEPDQTRMALARRPTLTAVILILLFLPLVLFFSIKYFVSP